jgi:hypothetical protein
VLSSYHFEIPMMFAAALFAALSGIGFFALIAILERVLVAWGEPLEG